MIKHTWKMIVRTSKKNSAFFYHLLEAHEGLCAYSTLEGFENMDTRDMELLIPEERVSEVRELMKDWQDFVTVISDAKPLA